MTIHLPRYAELWGSAYLSGRLRPNRATIRRVWVAVTDHYEPFWRKADDTLANRRVSRWRTTWPEIAEKIAPDSAGRKPRHTFFYPQEQYRPSLLASLAELVCAGIADVEVHIHHDRDTRESFIERVSTFCEDLHSRHGLLRKIDGRLSFGFIHGNWALDNSRDGRFCGVSDEIRILRELGCYADFTMPSGNSPTQSKIVNKIYWCTGDPQRAKSYDTGVTVTVGGGRKGDLLMITGPFGIRWAERLVPRIETGEIAGNDVCSRYRARRWFNLAPVIGEDLFIKLYTHGAQERNSDVLLKHGLLDMYKMVAHEARRRGTEIYYVSAWEMFKAVQALSEGRDPQAAVIGRACTAGHVR